MHKRDHRTQGPEVFPHPDSYICRAIRWMRKRLVMKATAAYISLTFLYFVSHILAFMHSDYSLAVLLLALKAGFILFVISGFALCLELLGAPSGGSGVTFPEAP
jgi:hypothetical protein